MKEKVRIIGWHEKEGDLDTICLGYQDISLETLDYVLFQYESILGFAIHEVHHNEKKLTQENILSIRQTYPCKHRQQELDKYFFRRLQNQ